MNEIINVEEIINASEPADILSSIINIIQEKTDVTNLKIIGYHCLPPIGGDFSDPISLVSCLGVSREKIEDYKQKRLYRYNPFVTKPLLWARSFLWADIFELPNLTRNNHCFIQAVEERFKGRGISIPVFGPFGHNGNVSIRFEPDTPPLSNSDILNLQVACQQMHLNICSSLQRQPVRTVSFTNREREVLEWVALGKSNSVIADIMGISAHTVNGYIRRLYLKLNVTNRVSAVFRALAIGAIN